MLIGQKVTIIGAGVAGLALSLALASRGAKVRVLEQGDGPSDSGGGLQISPNGVAVLDALGLGQPARAASVRSQAVSLIDGLSGQIVTRLDLARHAPDQDWLLFLRADLVGLLAKAAVEAGVGVSYGTRVETVEDGPRSARFSVQGQEQTTPLLISADGFHSAARHSLNGASHPFFTGQVAWRATVPTAGPVAPEARIYMGPGQHLVTYPLCGGTLQNIVAVEERETWADEGWHYPDDPQSLRAEFAGYAPEVTELLSRVTEVRLWGLFRHPVARHWHGHRLAVTGDAAHPTLPFLAQGANMALEDAWVLASMLADLPVDQALPAWQAARRPRVVRAIEAANANARNYHLRGITRYAAHKVLRIGSRLAPRAPMRRFDWLYRHDVTRG